MHDIISDEPGQETVYVYRVGALNEPGDLVNIIRGAAAREYIDRFIADCEERDYDETIRDFEAGTGRV
jgi:hypothetical protein